MKHYDYTLEGKHLRIATVQHGIIAFMFGDSPMPQLEPDTPEETKAEITTQTENENSIRAQIFDLITTDEIARETFVSLVAENPNTGFQQFTTQYKINP